MITGGGAGGGTTTTGGGGGGGGGAALITNVADPRLFKSSVARPSPDKTDTPVKEMVAVPAAFGIKVMVARVSDEPLKPGRGVPPVKVISPVLLENVGSRIQSAMTEPVFETEETFSKLGGNEIDASAAFAMTPFVFRIAVTVSGTPTVPVPDDGENKKPAAWLVFGNVPSKKNKSAVKPKRKFFHAFAIVPFSG